MKALRPLLFGLLVCLATEARAQTAYVSTGARLTAVEVQSGTILASRVTAGLLTSVALSRDGRRLEVASQNILAKDSIREYDRAGLGEIRAIDVGARLKTVISSSDGKLLFGVANHLTTVIDAKTGRTLTTLPRGFDQPNTAVAADGRVFIAEGLGRDVAVYRQGAADMTDFRDVARSLGGIALSNDGKRLYLTDQDANALIIINATTGARLRTIPVCRGPTRLALERAEKTAYVACAGYDFLDSEAKRATESGGLAIVDLMRGKVRRTVSTGGDPRALALTPNETRVVLGDSRSATLWVIRPTTGAVLRKIRLEGRAVLALAIAP